MSLERPQLTVDAVVFTCQGIDMQVLLIQRKYPPFAGLRALPGGFVQEGELPAQASSRELWEETGLNIPYYAWRELPVRGASGRDPRGWTVSCPFMTYVPEMRPGTLPDLTAGDDAGAAQWIKCSELQGELAFDHGAILCTALAQFWNLTGPGLWWGGKSIRAFGMPLLPAAECERIFYAGTFFPWHQGHQACVLGVINYLIKQQQQKQQQRGQVCTQSAEIIVLPDYNPQKKHNYPRPSPWDHYRQLQLKIDEITLLNGQFSLAVYPGFCGRELPNPTAYWPIDWGTKPSLLLGEDSFCQLPTWIAAPQLLSGLRRLYVVPRQGSMREREDVEKWMKGNNGLIEIIFLEHHGFEDVSSTQLRQQK